MAENTQKPMPKFLQRGLQTLKACKQCAALFTPRFLEKAAADGLIEDVPFEEITFHKGLRWVRLTDKGRESLAAAIAREAP